LANVYDEQCNASVIPDCDDRNLILTGRGAILVEAVEDVKIATDFATVSLKKGGLICIDSSTSSVRIKACSGPGHVSILSGPRKLDMLPGQELFLCDYIPNEEHKLPADGIGRRKLQMFSLNSKIQAVLCDYSVVTLIASRRAAFEAGLANRQYKRNIESKLLKTAAVIDQVTRKRGIYKAAL
jgi:hypothetical protein